MLFIWRLKLSTKNNGIGRGDEDREGWQEGQKRCGCGDYRIIRC
jgi:hypothetical protein